MSDQSLLNSDDATHQDTSGAAKQTFACRYCTNTFQSSSDQLKHERGHKLSPTRVYKCDICPEQFPRKVLLTEHKKNHTESDGKMAQKFQCDICSKEFTRKDHVKRHKDNIHFGMRSPKSERVCDICLKEFSTVHHLKFHKQKFHESGEGTENIEEPKDTECKVCGKQFSRWDTLTRHMAAAHSSTIEMPGEMDAVLLKCDICSEQFDQGEELQLHKKNVHGSEKVAGIPHKCDVCSMEFEEIKLLEEHKLTVHEGKKDAENYKCDKCSMVFSQSEFLKQHQQTNHDPKRHKCDICAKEFRQSGYLIYHQQKMHSMAPPKEGFKCDLCKEVFTKCEAMEKHERERHNLTSYKCEQCTDEFSTSTKLKNHKRRFHDTKDQYSCEICSKQYSRMDSLIRHIQEQHGNRTEILDKLRTKVQMSPGKGMNSGELEKDTMEENTKKGANKVRMSDGNGMEEGKMEKNAKKRANKEMLTEVSSENQLKSDADEENLEEGSEKGGDELKDRKMFKCDLCTKEFRHIGFLNHHTRTIHKGKTYKCDQCPKQYDQVSTLKNHKRRFHTGKDEFACTICMKQFSSMQNMKRHHKDAHGGTAELPRKRQKFVYNCDLCSEEFNESGLLEKHKEAVHHMETVPSKLECDLCSEEFETNGLMNLHKQNVHKITMEQHTTEASSPEASNLKDLECNKLTGNHRCDICSREFQQSGLLKIHRWNLHGAKTKQHECDFCSDDCDICSQKSGSANETLKSEQRNVREADKAVGNENCKLCLEEGNICAKDASHSDHGDARRSSLAGCDDQSGNDDKLDASHKCELCSEVFSENDLLKKHKENTHTVKKKLAEVHECDICFKQFRQSSYLIHHKENIHDIKPPVEVYSCDVCSQEFQQSKLLKRHKFKIHGVRERISCKVCSKTYSRPAHLMRHVQACLGPMKEVPVKRPGELPKRRIFRKKSFATKGSFSRSRKSGNSTSSASNPLHRCQYCRRSHVTLTEKIKHERTHTGMKPFGCQHCEYKYSRMDRLRTHIRLKHPDKTPPKKYSYRCDKCDEELTSEVWFDEHMTVHHPETVTMVTNELYNCEKCDDTNFTTQTELDEHTMMCRSESIPTCALCNKTFLTTLGLKHHRRLKHSEVVPAEQYRCNTCHDKFMSKSEFDEHVTKCESSLQSMEPYHCHKCNMAFTSETEFDEHMSRCGLESEPKMESYLCDRCCEVSSTKAAFIAHMMACQPENVQRQFSCYKCNREFSTEADVNEHTPTCRPNACDTCSKTFHSLYGLTEHKRRMHSQQQSVEPLTEHKRRMQSEQEQIAELYRCETCKGFISEADFEEHKVTCQGKSVSLYECQFCNRGYVRLQHKVRHEKTHTGIKPFACQDCSYKTTRLDRLQEHVRIRHSNKESLKKQVYRCDKCNKEFTSEGWFEKHMTVYHPESVSTSTEPYYCEKCNKYFTSETKFDKHTMICRSERVPTCIPCNKTFQSPHGLKLHRRHKHPESESATESNCCDKCNKEFATRLDLNKHAELCQSDSKERVLQCENCDERFATLGQLVKHKVTHTTTENKSVTCKTCGKGFASAVHLKRHESVHLSERPFKCQECDLSYKDRRGLTQHRMLHSGRVYACTICDKTFARKMNLRKHMQRVVPCTKRSKQSGMSGSDEHPDEKDQRNVKSDFNLVGKIEGALSDDTSASDGQNLQYEKVFSRPLLRRGRKDRRIPDTTIVRKTEHERMDTSASDGLGQLPVFALPLRRGRKDRRIPHPKMEYKIEQSDTSDTSDADQQGHLQDTSVINRVRDRCPSCQKRFTHPHDLRKHKSQCGARYPKRSSGEGALFGVKHLLGQSMKESVYKCNDCEETFENIITLGVHSCSKGNLQYCQYCQECFEDSESLAVHEKTHLEAYEEQSSLGLETDGSPAVKAHFDVKEELVVKEVLDGDSVKENRADVTDVEKLKECTAKDNLNWSKTDGGLNELTVVNGSINSSTARNVDNSTMDKSYYCGVCQKGFDSFAESLNHERLHGDEEESRNEADMTESTSDACYNCTSCQKSYTSFSECFIHERSHQSQKDIDPKDEDEKPILCSYTCGYCKMAFKTKLSLTAHMDSHKERNNNDTSGDEGAKDKDAADEGALPYECQQCQRRFTCLADCWKHEQVHSEDNTFVNGESSVDGDHSESNWITDTTDKDTSDEGSDTNKMLSGGFEESKPRMSRKQASCVRKLLDPTSSNKRGCLDQNSSFSTLLSGKTPEKESLYFELVSPSSSNGSTTRTYRKRASSSSQRSTSNKRVTPDKRNSVTKLFTKVTPEKSSLHSEVVSPSGSEANRSRTGRKSSLHSEVVSPSGSEASSTRTRTGRTVVTPLRYREYEVEGENDGSDLEEMEDLEEEDEEVKEDADIDGVEKIDEDDADIDGIEKMDEEDADMDGVEKMDEEDEDMDGVEKMHEEDEDIDGVEKIDEEDEDGVEKMDKKNADGADMEQQEDGIDSDKSKDRPETSQVQNSVKRNKGRPRKVGLVARHKGQGRSRKVGLVARHKGQGRSRKVGLDGRRKGLRCRTSKLLSKATRASRHVRLTKSEEIGSEEELEEDEEETKEDEAWKTRRPRTKLKAAEVQSKGSNANSKSSGQGKSREVHHVVASREGLRHRKPQSKDSRNASGPSLPCRTEGRRHIKSPSKDARNTKLGRPSKANESSIDIQISRGVRVNVGVTQAGFQMKNALSHKCSLCPMTFRGQRSLEQHEIVHVRDGRYKCTECTASYNVVGHLRSHERLHTGKYLKCKFCPKVSIWEDGIARHILSQHSKDL